MNDAKKFSMAFALALIGLLDNVASWIAVQVNPKVKELNPIVAFFMQNPIHYAFFTVLKCAFMFYVAYTLNYERKIDYVVYAIVAVVFCQAIITALINILW